MYRIHKCDFIAITGAEVNTGTQTESLHAASIIFMSVCNYLCWQLWFANEPRGWVCLGLGANVVPYVAIVVAVAGLEVYC